MHILVINGSPKGEYSVTLQTVLYLQKKFSAVSFEFLHAGQKIKALEKDFSPAVQAMEKADCLLFAYPVYTFLAPSQLHRFIELMKEHAVKVSGKVATQVTTSKHFYDTTAHRYIQDNMQELGIQVIRGLSADMEDLPTEKGRQEAESWFAHLLWSAERGYFEPSGLILASGFRSAATVPENVQEEKTGDVVIIADLGPEDVRLKAMVERFRAKLTRASRVVNIREYPFRGGCLGCFRCAVSGKCVYRDNFDEFLRNDIQRSEAMVYAFTIRDHSMGSRFKMYDDRQFCNGHRTVTTGMPVGYIISGELRCEENLRTVIEGRAQVGGNILAGIATDEENADAAIDRLADSLVYSLAHKNTAPRNFYGVGGMKIFRDLIYTMRGFMRADHKFFRSHGQYDFPHKQWPKSLAMYLIGAMMTNPKLHAKMGNKMNEGMLMPYKKVLDQTK